MPPTTYAPQPQAQPGAAYAAPARKAGASEPHPTKTQIVVSLILVALIALVTGFAEVSFMNIMNNPSTVDAIISSGAGNYNVSSTAPDPFNKAGISGNDEDADEDASDNGNANKANDNSDESDGANANSMNGNEDESDNGNADNDNDNDNGNGNGNANSDDNANTSINVFGEPKEDERKANANNTVNSETEKKLDQGSEPFWGVWGKGYWDAQDALDAEAKAKENGWPEATLCYAGDWENLQHSPSFVICLQKCDDKAEADKAAEKARKGGYPEAYAKDTGKYIGEE